MILTFFIGSTIALVLCIFKTFIKNKKDFLVSLFLIFGCYIIGFITRKLLGF